MAALPAYDGITLALGDHAVRLRPTLRAAHRLPSPPDLARDVLDLHTGTIADIITVSASDRGEAETFLAAMDATPFRTVHGAITAPLLTFIIALNPTPEDEGKPAPDAEPMEWRDVVRLLYRRTTGALGWTPEEAWSTTPTEIVETLSGWHEANQPPKEVEGSEKLEGAKPYNEQRLAEIEEQGFDPAFDREGLRALKAKLARGA